MAPAKLRLFKEGMSTGYEGPDTDPPKWHRWNVVRGNVRQGVINAVITCNDESRGMVTCFSEEEFEWLRARIQGVVKAPSPSPLNVLPG